MQFCTFRGQSQEIIFFIKKFNAIEVVKFKYDIKIFVNTLCYDNVLPLTMYLGQMLFLLFEKIETIA